jgi:uncharacterized protein YxjI
MNSGKVVAQTLRNITVGLLVGATVLGAGGCSHGVKTGVEVAGGSAAIVRVADPHKSITLPADYQLKERAISLTNEFEVVSGNKVFGKVEQKLLSLTHAFTFKDASGDVVARAAAEPFSWGVKIAVTDAGGSTIGTIKENVLKSMLRVSSEYEVFDAAGKKVATSKRGGSDPEL